LDVQVIGNYAYLANGKEGLEIIDISDPTHLEKIGEFNESCSKIKVEGNRAFISSSSFPIKIIDISNPGIPNKIGEITGTGLNYRSIINFEVSGNFLYVLNFVEGLSIFNVTDVTNPTLISQFQGDYMFTYGFDIVGNLVYISGDTLSYTNSIFIILDISDPANPLEIWKEIGYIYAYDILINGDFAYCNFGDGFRIYNIANPSNITQLGSYSDNGEYINLFASEDYIYLVDYYYGLKIIDVSDPINPTKIAGFEDGEYFSDLL
ncbi:MAG: LVIVD repeat-containing protein, partial [Promethearchaeota archaeon]